MALRGTSMKDNVAVQNGLHSPVLATPGEERNCCSNVTYLTSLHDTQTSFHWAIRTVRHRDLIILEKASYRLSLAICKWR